MYGVEVSPDLISRVTDGVLEAAANRLHTPDRQAQRWTPEELLCTLVEAEIAARDSSNARARLKAAAFPVTKALEEFDTSVSSIPGDTLDYLGSLEWLRAAVAADQARSYEAVR